MERKLGSLLIVGLGLALLGYTATRSIDFIQLTLPPDRQIMAWFGLMALDGGLLAWMLLFRFGARGQWQRGIALVMIVADFLGAVVMFTADTLYQASATGMIASLSPETIQAIILALSIIIAANVGAVIAYHLTDPEAMRAAAQEDARSKIEDAAIRRIANSSDVLAEELAPKLADDWMDTTRRRYTAMATHEGPKVKPTQGTRYTMSETHPPQPAARVTAVPLAGERRDAPAQPGGMSRVERLGLDPTTLPGNGKG